ncbi:T-complex protein 1 subunit gamma [Frankliniella fusca]|uniref:T-complex protein 1 subunit gamma n=1 Tax=Frankliniella fusca TaxID=407009 RepID=A0AAE1H3D7_9NEOP|nr:T-complex protein 1 subunit gamma [Frankliniella fusca]
MEVVADSVPSPPRQYATTCDLRPKPALVSDPPQPERASVPNVEDEPVKTNSGASASDKPSRKGKNNKRRGPVYSSNVTNVSVNNCSSVVIGNTFTYYNGGLTDPENGRKDQKKMLSEDDQKLLDCLKNSSKTVEPDDLSIVSVCFSDIEGVEIVAKELKVENKFRLLKAVENDIQEICLKMLEYWTDLRTSQPGIGAMLNILSDALKHAHDKGGLQAIRKLHAHHYPSSKQ